jgi:hypothetical protein
MDTKQIEKIIRNLGYTYQALIDNKIIEATEPRPLYLDSDTLEIELEGGFELVFSKGFLRFEMIHLSCGANKVTGTSSFSNMPYPLNRIICKSETRKILGEPIYSASDLELLETDLYGWDTYQLSPNLHPAALLEVQYDSQLDTIYLAISLMDR